MVKIFSTTILVLTLASCGGNGGPSGGDASNKNLAITVSGSRSFNSEIDHGRIDHYLVSITAEDVADPIEDVVGGTAEGTTLYGVPAGNDRQLTVTAYNQNNVVIRRAFKEGITVMAGHITETSVHMNSVPIITNLNPGGAAVASDRINFEIFGEPGSKLNVINVTNEDEEDVMVDATLNAKWVDTSNEDGLFSFDPGTLEYGNYIFKVEDTETKESSTVTVALYKTLARPGVAFGSGGSVGKIGDELVITKAGGAFYQNTQLRNVHVSSSGFLNQVDILSE